MRFKKRRFSIDLQGNTVDRNRMSPHADGHVFEVTNDSVLTIKDSKARAFKVKGAKGKLKFKKISGNKKIKIASNGKVIVKKGLKKGRTYSVKVKVTAKGDANYKENTKKVKLKIKVK